MINPDVRFCIRCGHPLEIQEKFGSPHSVCPQCGWIYFADPKVAAAALIERNGQVLLVRRINEPQRGRWSLPAGFVDAYEDPARAAEREALEETGLIVRVVRLLDVIAGREHPHGADMIIVYQAEIVSGELIAGDDADLANFFPLDQLPPLAFTATHRILGVK